MADLRHRNGPPDGFPAAVISRVIIHVDGPPGAGKTTFVERLLGALDGWVLAVRCRRSESLRQARESSSARDPEVYRYRAAGASDAGRFTFPAAQDSADDFFTSRLLTDVSDVVVIEGDSPLRDADLRVFVAPAPAAGQTLLVRQRRDHVAQLRARTAAMERLLGEPDGAARLLEQLVGGPVVALARERPELLEQARVGLLAGIGKIRTAPPLAPTEHWAVAAGYAGIEYAQLVVVNACQDAERRRAHSLLEDVQRLRADQAVFDDVLGWRGSRVPITAVVADLADARDPGTRRAVARVKRTVRAVPGRHGPGSDGG
jgi:molybdopterin-guanine dinucleotide biosynthesis protein